MFGSISVQVISDTCIENNNKMIYKKRQPDTAFDFPFYGETKAGAFSRLKSRECAGYLSKHPVPSGALAASGRLPAGIYWILI